MLLSTLFGIKSLQSSLLIDFRGLIILLVLVLTGLILNLVLKKKPSPIIMILISAGLGMIIYSI
jgi:chromate transporter